MVDAAVLLRHVIELLEVESDASRHLPHALTLLHTHGLVATVLADTSDTMEVRRHEYKRHTKAWLGLVATLLRSRHPDARWVGTVLVGETAGFCGEAIFLAQLGAWVEALAMLLKRPEIPITHVAAGQATIVLIRRAFAVRESRRDAPTHLAALVLPLLALVADESHCLRRVDALAQIDTLVETVPTNYRPFITRTETLVQPLLCHVDPVVASTAASILAGLTRSKGTEDAWNELLRTALGSMRDLVNIALGGVEETVVGSGQDTLSSFPAFSFPDVPTFCTLAHRYRILAGLCRILLTGRFSVAVAIPIPEILDHVRRVLALTPVLRARSNPRERSLSLLEVESILPLLHQYALDVVDALVTGTHALMIPHCRVLTMILNELLRRGSTVGTRSPLQCAVYGLARKSLVCMGATIGEQLGPIIVPHILENVRPVSHVSPPADTLQPTQAKKRKKGGTGASLALRTPHDGGRAPRGKISHAALCALEALLLTTAPLLPDSLRTTVDKTLITILSSAVDASASSFQGSSHFRQCVFRCLLASVSSSPTLLTSPTLPHALRFFQMGARDPNMEVAVVCRQGLSMCDVIIHPRAPPLYVPPDSTRIRTQQPLPSVVSNERAIQTEEQEDSGSSPPLSSPPPSPPHVASPVLDHSVPVVCDEEEMIQDNGDDVHEGKEREKEKEKEEEEGEEGGEEEGIPMLHDVDPDEGEL